MTNEEVAVLRQRVNDYWQAKVAATPVSLLAVYERLVEACLTVAAEGNILPETETVTE